MGYEVPEEVDTLSTSKGLGSFQLDAMSTTTCVEASQILQVSLNCATAEGNIIQVNLHKVLDRRKNLRDESREECWTVRDPHRQHLESIHSHWRSERSQITTLLI